MLKLELQSNPQKASIKPLKPHNPKWCEKKTGNKNCNLGRLLKLTLHNGC